jgi:hypothetical protein
MKRRKGHKKKSGPSIPLSPEDNALLDSLLAKREHETPELLVRQIPNQNLVLAFVDHLPTDDNTGIPFLQALHKIYPQKDIQKAIKRAAFKLRQNGFEAPNFAADSTPGTSFSLKPDEREEAEVFLGIVDGHGSRGVYVSLPRMPSGYDIGIGLVNDQEGIIEFHAAHCSKKRMKELKAAVQGEMEVTVPSSVSHALTVLEKAYERSLQGTMAVPEDYLEFRSLMLSRGGVLDRSPVYDVFPEWSGEGNEPTLSQLEKLFSHPSMKNWVFTVDEMEPLLLQLEGAGEGPLLLSEAQREDRVRAIKERWAKTYFPPEKLNFLRYRLEEMAYVFCRQDEKEHSALALSAAAALSEIQAFQAINPVFNFLLEKTLVVYKDLGDEMDKNKEPLVDPSPRIILP